MTSLEVRRQLVRALKLDLVGPERDLGNSAEVLSQAPSRWYLTGFLVPLDAEAEQRGDADSTDELDQQADGAGADENNAHEPASARQRYLPSSIGMSMLVTPRTKRLKVIARWGDYKRNTPSDGHGGGEQWERKQREEVVVVDLPSETPQGPLELDVPDSRGLKVAVSVRGVVSDGAEGKLPRGTRSVSVFLVNRRVPAPDDTRDEAFAFQSELEVHSGVDPFVARPNLSSLERDDWDERVSDLQYRDACEYAVGHNVATQADVTDCICRVARTCWIPQAEVELVAPAEIAGVERSMDALSRLVDGADAQVKLGAFVAEYRKWIDEQRQKVPATPVRRREIGEELLQRAGHAAGRIEQGINLLADPQVLEAFRVPTAPWRLLRGVGKG